MNYKLSITTVLIVLFATYAYAGEKEDLAKKSQNPVGNIISVPFEYWHYDGMANDSSGDVFVIKPVYPLGIGKVTLINRLILPFVGIDANTPGEDLGAISTSATNSSESGLGNFQYKLFLHQLSQEKSYGEQGRFLISQPIPVDLARKNGQRERRYWF